MANLPVPNYYDQFTAKERSYIDYMGEINKSISSEIEKSTNKQIAADALFAGEIKSTLINNQIATENALYNHTQQIDGTLMAGFSGVSRQLGSMGSDMNMGFAFLNSVVQESSTAICAKLDDINETLKNPLQTEARELYNMALRNYNKKLYEETLENLQEAIKKYKTEPLSHFLMGQTYLRGINDFCNVIDLDASIEALKNAVKYIKHDADTYYEVRPMAAEIYFYLGLAHHAKANDSLHNSNNADYEKHLKEAKDAYNKSWDYSQDMLESLFNLARCKALSNEQDDAINNLITVILKDHGYCIKSFTESDFDNVFKKKLVSELKKEVYPEVKDYFDSIENIKSNFPTNYSYNLERLMEKHLPKSFTREIPPLDMLAGSFYFPEILSTLQKEKKDFEDKRREQERIAEENRRRQEQDRIERERRTIKEKKAREEKERRDAQARKQRLINEKQEQRRKIGRVFSILFAMTATIMAFVINSYDPTEIVYLIIMAIINLVPFLVIFFAEEYIKKAIFFGIGICISIFVIGIYAGADIEGTIMPSVGLGICNLISCILAFIFPKD